MFNNFRNAAANFSKTATSGIPSGGGAGGSLVGTIVGLGFGAYGVYHSFQTVGPGQMGIFYSRVTGMDEKNFAREGLNFKIPWLQRIHIFDVRTKWQELDSVSGSKDLQSVKIKLRVMYKPDPEHLVTIYRRLGPAYDSSVLPSIVNEVSKAVVAQYNAAELLTRREEVSRKIRELLTKRGHEFNILLDDVSITHLNFSKEYTAAVEAKQVAQQEAERGKYIVEKALQEKRKIVIRAQGEAESAQLIGAAIRDNPAFIQLRRIDAAREVASTIVQSQNKVYLSADTLMLNYLGESPKDTKDKAKLSKLLPW